jgi:hypothetical protein
MSSTGILPVRRGVFIRPRDRHDAGAYSGAAGVSGYFQCPLFFAVYATAIFLPVQPQFTIFLHPFVPTLSPIPIHKGDAVVFRSGLTNGFQELMLLKPAVEKGCGKCLETSGFGETNRLVHPEAEADSAFLRLSKDHLAEPIFHAFLSVFVQDAHSMLSRIRRESIEPSQILGVRVDVRIKKSAVTSWPCDLRSSSGITRQGAQQACRRILMKKVVSFRFS